MRVDAADYMALCLLFGMVDNSHANGKIHAEPNLA